jgi:hypothetical protein
MPQIRGIAGQQRPCDNLNLSQLALRKMVPELVPNSEGRSVINRDARSLCHEIFRKNWGFEGGSVKPRYGVHGTVI